MIPSIMDMEVNINMIDMAITIAILSNNIKHLNMPQELLKTPEQKLWIQRKNVNALIVLNQVPLRPQIQTNR
jgi:hypothetical protein